MRDGAGIFRSTKRRGYHPHGASTMRISRQLVGGVLIGLAFGMFIGAALAEGKKQVNSTAMAGVGMILAITGVATARTGSPRS